jgi:hypothetical protein
MFNKIKDFLYYNIYCVVSRNLSNAWYWVRTHTYNRYHIIDIRNKDHGYRWGWIDRDQVLLLACFKILVDFVEQEQPFGPGDFKTDYDHSEEMREVKATILELYNWWKYHRKAEHSAVSGLLDTPHDYGELFSKPDERGWCTWTATPHPNGKIWFDRDVELTAKDDEMLLKLMKIRSKLWT